MLNRHNDVRGAELDVRRICISSGPSNLGPRPGHSPNPDPDPETRE
jgi:hypothetical protein